MPGNERITNAVLNARMDGYEALINEKFKNHGEKIDKIQQDISKFIKDKGEEIKANTKFREKIINYWAATSIMAGVIMAFALSFLQELWKKIFNI